MTFPVIAALPDHVQATAFGPGPEYCNIYIPWTTVGGAAYINGLTCYNATTVTPSRFFATYVSPV